MRVGQKGLRIRPWGGEGENGERLGPGRMGQECLGEKSLCGGRGGAAGGG